MLSVITNSSTESRKASKIATISSEKGTQQTEYGEHSSAISLME